LSRAWGRREGGREGGRGASLTCDLELLPIEVGPVALGGKEKLVFERVEDDADHHSLLDGQGDGDAGEGEAVHEVGGACLCMSIFGR